MKGPRGRELYQGESITIFPATTTAGAVTVAYAASAIIGMSMQVVPVSATVCPVFLQID